MGLIKLTTEGLLRYTLIASTLLLAQCFEAPDPNNPKSSGTSGEDDSNIDRPEMVAGSFLTCQVVENEIGIKDPNYVSTGCQMADENGQKKKIPTEIDSALTVYNLYNQKVNAELTEAPANSAYHWYVYIPMQDFRKAKVEAKLIHKNSHVERKSVSYVKGEPIQTGNRPIPIDSPVHEQVAAQDYDLHLGDMLDPNNAGSSSMAKECAGVQRQNVKHSGQQITLPFEVSAANTRVAITLENICGVSLTGNTASIRKQGASMAEVTSVFGYNSRELVLDGLNAAPGRYLLVISAFSNSQPANYDDFIVGSIRFISSSPIVVDEAAASVLAPQSLGPEPGTRSSIKSSLSAVPGSTSGVNQGRANQKKLNVAVAGGTHIIAYRYKIVSGAESCLGEGYNPEAPIGQLIEDDISSVPDGVVKICVVAKDNENYWQPKSSATLGQWIKDTIAEKVILSGLPADKSNPAALSVTVSGSDVVKYRYKVGPVGSTDCSNNNGYSNEIDRGTKIKAALNFPDGELRVCVVSKDSLGNQQALGDAVSFSWEKKTPEPPPPPPPPPEPAPETPPATP